MAVWDLSDNFSDFVCVNVWHIFFKFKLIQALKNSIDKSGTVTSNTIWNQGYLQKITPDTSFSPNAGDALAVDPFMDLLAAGGGPIVNAYSHAISKVTEMSDIEGMMDSLSDIDITGGIFTLGKQFISWILDPEE